MPTNELTTITPETAPEMLAHRDEHQRNVRFYKVQIMAGLMKQGPTVWMLNGDSIKFDKNGSLIDGQHRLEAVVLSGATIQSYVVRGLEPKSFSTLDAGIPRKLHDTFCTSGLDRASERASLVTWLWRFERGPLGVNRREGAPPIVALEIHKKWVKQIDASLQAVGTPKGVQKRWVAFIRMLYVVTVDQVDPEKLELWCKKFTKGFPMEENDSAAHLREYLVDWSLNCKGSSNSPGRKVGKFGPSRPPVFMIKSWNYFMIGKKVKSLRLIKNEKWQGPVGLHPEFKAVWTKPGLAPRGRE